MYYCWSKYFYIYDTFAINNVCVSETFRSGAHLSWLFYNQIHPNKPSSSFIYSLECCQLVVSKRPSTGPQCLALVMMLAQRMIFGLLSRFILFFVSFPIVLLISSSSRGNRRYPLYIRKLATKKQIAWRVDKINSSATNV